MWCLTNIRKFVTVSVILRILACDSCLAQDSQSMSSPATGTLNLLLANRKGFVIAADSRMTQLSQPVQYWDDSQKLFKVGPEGRDGYRRVCELGARQPHRVPSGC